MSENTTPTLEERTRDALDNYDSPFYWIEIPPSVDADHGDIDGWHFMPTRTATVAQLRLAEEWLRRDTLAEFEAKIRRVDDLATLLACVAQADPADDETVGNVLAHRNSPLDIEDVKTFKLMRACEDPSRSTQDIINEFRADRDKAAE